MPLYGNTHTTTSVTGLQTTLYRQEARELIAASLNARIQVGGVSFFLGFFFNVHEFILNRTQTQQPIPPLPNPI